MASATNLAVDATCTRACQDELWTDEDKSVTFDRPTRSGASLARPRRANSARRTGPNIMPTHVSEAFELPGEMSSGGGQCILHRCSSLLELLLEYDDLLRAERAVPHQVM